MLESCHNNRLVGETIKEIKFGHPEKKHKGSYGAYTLVMESGRKFVISEGLGEINFAEDLPDESPKV
jgi:hypothetical protein